MILLKECVEFVPLSSDVNQKEPLTLSCLKYTKWMIVSRSVINNIGGCYTPKCGFYILSTDSTRK